MMNMLKIMNMGTEFCTDEKLKKMDETTRILHNREVEAYKMLAEEKNPKIPITKIYASKQFDRDNKLKGFIISEYIENLKHIGMHESISVEDLKPMIRSAAAFSAIGEKRSKDDLKFAGQGDFFEILLGNMEDDKTHETRNAMMRNAFSKQFEEKVDQVIQIYDKYYMRQEMFRKYKNICQYLGHEPVLTHSDLWGSNLLCTRDGGGKVDLKAFIDWQTVSFTSPGHEMARLFVACLTKKDRREKLEELLKFYYTTFIEELDGRPVPYTFQQLHDGYNLFFPMMASFVFPGIPMLVEHAQVPDEEKEVLRESAMDKAVGMLEDIIEIHEWNIKHYPEFFEAST